MTLALIASLRPGDVCLNSKTGALRVVLENGAKAIGLRKIGRSWTDPNNPGAWYMHGEIADRLETTGARATLHEREIQWARTHRRLPSQPSPAVSS